MAAVNPIVATLAELESMRSTDAAALWLVARRISSFSPSSQSEEKQLQALRATILFYLARVTTGSPDRALQLASEANTLFESLAKGVSATALGFKVHLHSSCCYEIQAAASNDPQIYQQAVKAAQVRRPRIPEPLIVAMRLFLFESTSVGARQRSGGCERREL